MRAAMTAGSGGGGVLRRRRWAWTRTAVGEDGGVGQDGSFQWWRHEGWGPASPPLMCGSGRHSPPTLPLRVDPPAAVMGGATTMTMVAAVHSGF